MRVAILNGNPDGKYTGFDPYIDQVAKALQNNGSKVTHLKIRDLKIQFCTGCFGCWIKEPGTCVVKDDFPAGPARCYKQRCDTVRITGDHGHGKLRFETRHG